MRFSLRGMTPDYVPQHAASGDLADRDRPAAAMPAGAAAGWRVLRQASRACCCPARPVVIAVMPPAPGRDHATDLLLCGHHYRASRLPLLAAGAAVYDRAGRTMIPPARALLAAR